MSGRTDEDWKKILNRAEEIGVVAAAREFGLSDKAIYNKRLAVKGGKRSYVRKAVKATPSRQASPQVHTIIASPKPSSKAVVVLCEVSDLSRIISEMQNG